MGVKLFQVVRGGIADGRLKPQLPLAEAGTATETEETGWVIKASQCPKMKDRIKRNRIFAMGLQ